jgi:hypothetical protein
MTQHPIYHENQKADRIKDSVEAVLLPLKHPTLRLQSITPCLHFVVRSEDLSSTSSVPSGPWLSVLARFPSEDLRTIAIPSLATNGTSFSGVSSPASVLARGTSRSQEPSCL